MSSAKYYLLFDTIDNNVIACVDCIKSSVLFIKFSFHGLCRVRSRAIVAFSQCFTTADSGIRSTLREIVTPVAGPRPAHLQHLIPTPEMENRVQNVVEGRTRSTC